MNPYFSGIDELNVDEMLRVAKSHVYPLTDTVQFKILLNCHVHLLSMFDYMAYMHKSYIISFLV